jgi:hypothetical protein
MKFIILRTNCLVFNITIIKDGRKNKVFESYEEIDNWIVENNFNKHEFSILRIEESEYDLKTILNTHISKT